MSVNSLHDGGFEVRGALHVFIWKLFQGQTLPTKLFTAGHVDIDDSVRHNLAAVGVDSILVNVKDTRVRASKVAHLGAVVGAERLLAWSRDRESSECRSTVREEDDRYNLDELHDDV